MKTTRKISTTRLISVPILILTIISCQKDPGDLLEKPATGKDGLTVMIGGQKYMTKSSNNINDIYNYNLEEIDGIDGLILSEEISSLDDTMYMQPETKGTPVYNENFDALYSEQFYATAFEPTSGKTLFENVWGSDYGDNGNVRFMKTGPNTYYYDYSSSASGLPWNLSWPENGKLYYFFQAPYDKTSTVRPSFISNGDIEFDYTDPTSPSYPYGKNPVIENPAAGQSDMLFSSKLLELKDGSTSAVYDVTLYHVFTAIKFRIGNIDKNVRTEIKKVTLTNIRANGHCIVSPQSGTSIWGGHSMEEEMVVDYSQTYSGIVDYNHTNSSFADSFYNGKSETANLNNADCSETLFLIPQNLTSTEIIIDFTIDGEEFIRKAKLNSTWKAGELHTYTLTVNKVDVKVTDEMDDNLTIKSNVVTANTGNVTAYLRATAVLAWYYGYGEAATIVAPYNGKGIFLTDGKEGYDSFWIKGEDGNYYYPLPIDPGQSTIHRLFDSFSAPMEEQESPFPGAHLEMRILLQGVQFDEDHSKKRLISAWGGIKAADGSGDLVIDRMGITPETKL